MDRQSLLEQKRQRLQELKQRRLGGSGDVSQVDLLLEKLDEPKKTLVSVGIQVGVVEPVGISKIQEHDALEKEKISYDKAIQTIEMRIEREVDAPLPIVNETIQTEEVDEVEVNTAIYEAMKQMEEEDRGEVPEKPQIPQSSYISNESELDYPFQLLGSTIPIKRSVTCIDVSPHFKDVVVASFAPSDTNESPGLAVIYNLSTKEDYILHSTAPIVQIRFDNVNPDKVIGGLADGKVVIWETRHISSKLPLLPLLSTPPFSTLSSSTIKNHTGITFDHHTLPVTSIQQLKLDANDSIVSFSLDGVINIWSTNLLASPVVDSIRLFLPNESSEFTNHREAIRITSTLIMDDKRTLFSSDDLKFLDSVIVASQRGEVYHLTNSRKDGYIQSTFNPPLDHTNITTDISSLFNDSKDTFFFTSHLDWTLKVWCVEKAFNVVISTNCLVQRICSRPHHSNQIVTLGLTNEASRKSTLLQFWDLGYKLFGHLFEIPLDSDFVGTSVEFNQDGTRLLVGGSNGEVKVFEIDEQWLVEKIHAIQKIDMDEGLQKYPEENE